jgi:uncharacterized protein YrzB (UPF0473 family)
MKFVKALFFVIFLATFTFQANSETSWITKKSDKTKTEIKLEKKEKKNVLKKKSEWIKKKEKKNKEEFKKEDKKITKDVKSWITKKNIKDKYIESINNLPESNIYFVAKSDTGKIFYGFINADLKSRKIGNYYETSIGKGYFNDGETICQIASTVREVFEGDVEGRVAGNCSDGTKFRGTFSQNISSGYGSAKSNKGEKFEFDFNSKLNVASNIIKELNRINSDGQLLAEAPKTDIEVKPDGKYYALLIGNAKYDKWASLSSPVNDVNEIHKVLKKKYDFTKILKVVDGNRKEIFKKLKELKSLSTDNDYVLIYYAGHGEQETDQAYWIPVDGEKDENSGEWINTMDIGVKVQNIKARHILLMVDSCFVGSVYRGNSDKYLNKSDEEMNAAEVNKFLKNRARLFLSSGGEEPVKDTVVNNHSLFAYKFIDMLKKNENYITTGKIFREISKVHSDINQTPQLGTVSTWGHLNGEFVFIVKK